MKRNLLNLISAIAVIVIAVGVYFGFHPAEATGVLELCVDWVTGFTAHTDGLSMAILPGLVALRKKKADLADEARKLLDKATADGVLAEADEARYKEIMTSIGQVDGQIKREEQLASVESTITRPDAVRSVEAGQGSNAPAAPASVGNDRGAEARMAFNTIKMLNALATRNVDTMRTAQRDLAREGHYGPEAQQRAAGDYYSTLVDADGALLLPTTVVQQIEQIDETLGVARQLCTVYDHVTGTLRVPGSSGLIRAAAVAEGAAITAKMRAFKAVNLNPKKWAIILPWTYEINLEAGPSILADANIAIKSGFLHSEDNALFNGDGTGAYNSINGILSANRPNVAEYVLPATKTSFDDISGDDIFLLRRKVPASVRSRCSYVFHPDMDPVIRNLKDGDGKRLYDFNQSNGVETLGGRPVLWTEVLPSVDDDAPETTFGVFGYFPAFKIAVGEGMTSEELREGTITDADTGGAINLATQDLRALKVRQFIDMGCNFDEVFCKITTAEEAGE